MPRNPTLAVSDQPRSLLVLYLVLRLVLRVSLHIFLRLFLLLFLCLASRVIRSKSKRGGFRVFSSQIS